MRETKKNSLNSNKELDVFIGGELYSNRMYPKGCPSYQKLAIKLFKVIENPSKIGRKRR